MEVTRYVRMVTEVESLAYYWCSRKRGGCFPRQHDRLRPFFPLTPLVLKAERNGAFGIFFSYLSDSSCYFAT